MSQLGRQVAHLEEPIHILAVCSGGKTVGKEIAKYLKQTGIKASYFEVWTNIVGGKATIWKSDFKKSDYVGTALITEDVIWKGTSVETARKMLKKMKNKKVYIAVILDFNHKADFAIFR